MIQDFDYKELSQAQLRLEEAQAFLHIVKRTEELKKLDEELADPMLWDDAKRAQELSKRAAQLRKIVESYNRACTLLEDCKLAYDFALDDDDFAADLEANLAQLTSMLDEFEIQSWFSGPFDMGSAIVSINPGSGGLEAQDWTSMLYRMYSRYIESKGWTMTILDKENGDGGVGLNKVSFQVDGDNAYGMLSSESGVHRLVRISPTDDKKRRHTTFAGVEVLPVLDDDIEVNLSMNDVRVDVFRSSGPGGQCVNTTDSAVRLTHAPTGIVVTCQNEKSQLQNKEAALRVLRAKLYEIESRKRQDEIDQLRGEKLDNSFGSQIRNYVLYPYQLVKDLRSSLETGNVDQVLNGEIDNFVIGYHRYKASL